MKLKTKISAFTTALIILIIAGISSFVFLAQKKILVTEMEERRTAIAKGFARVSSDFLQTKDQITMINYIKSLKEEKDIVYAMLYGINGKVMIHSDFSKMGADTGTLKAYPENEVAEVSLPAWAGREKAFLKIGFSRAAQNERIAKSLAKTGRSILVVSAAAIAGGVFGSFFLSHFLTRPIRKMADGAKRIGQGHLDTVIDVKNKDELGELAEELNAMAVKLKELEEHKREITYNITHELRSPLTSVGLGLEVIANDCQKYFSAQYKELIELSITNVRRIRKFVDDLLDTAKMEQGKLEINPVSTSIKSAITVPVQSAMVQARNKKIQLTIDVPDNLPPVSIDSERVQQVVMNLVNNAVKFTPENGKVEVKACDTGTQYVMVSVYDTGIGIPKEDLNRIFIKFEQAKGIRQQIKGPKGTGLGLSIAKSLIELHGGKIWAESEPQKGSCFHFTVPKANDVQQEEQSLKLQTRKILNGKPADG